MYVKIVNNTPSVFPYNVGELRKDHPTISFPTPIPDSVLEQFDVYPVVPSSPPYFDNKTHYLTQKAKKVNGQWQQVWSIEQQSVSDASENVRIERNKRLADCDWTQLADAPVDRTAWATYRQALRDVTAQTGFPWSIEWPQQP